MDHTKTTDLTYSLGFHHYAFKHHSGEFVGSVESELVRCSENRTQKPIMQASNTLKLLSISVLYREDGMQRALIIRELDRSRKLSETSLDRCIL